jgi:hypothetical protein
MVINRGKKLRNLEKTLLQCHFNYQQSHMKSQVTEHDASRREASVWTLELWKSQAVFNPFNAEFFFLIQNKEVPNDKYVYL